MDNRRELVAALERKALLARLNDWEREVLGRIEDAYRSETIYDKDGAGVAMLRVLLSFEQGPWSKEQADQFDALAAEVAPYADQLRGHSQSDKRPQTEDERLTAIGDIGAVIEEFRNAR